MSRVGEAELLGDRSTAGIAMPRPVVFWVGIAAITLGVAGHVPMFLDARAAHYMLHGMGVGVEMVVGMVAIAAGLVLTVVGLLPRSRAGSARVASVDVHVQEGGVGIAHVSLLLVLTIAVVIDAMKPATLSFVVPGMADEYGLTSAGHPNGSLPVALLPLAGASGMSLGALLWGQCGDWVGRRVAILFSGVLFIATAVCGAMPYFGLNLAMCFVMGIGVGGMIPITFALLAETIPARHRGFAMVLVGAAVASAFALTSALSNWLVPEFGWRILWLLGLPTGLLLIALNRWIPESPRFLVGAGRRDEAEAVLARFGARLDVRHPLDAGANRIQNRWRQLVAPGYAGLTLAICLIGVSVGFLTFGFQLWAPSTLPELGVGRVDSNEIIRNAAFIAIPVTAAVAPMYGYWSSKGTILLVGALVAASLGVLAIGGKDVAASRPTLYALVVLPIAGASSLLMMVAAYSSEVYPTEIRARGGGAATSASRVGGVLIICSVVFSVVSPSLETMAAAGATAVVVALAVLIPYGVETRQRSLETITREELGAEPSG
jgi:putative MFS transporter